MELVRWQQRFERWLEENHSTDDTAHDISHFRRVWMTAQKIMADQAVEPLVILTVCYFHDIVSLPKIPNAAGHPRWQRAGRVTFCAATSLIFRQSTQPASRTRLRRTASAPELRRRAWKPKLRRTQTGWKR